MCESWLLPEIPSSSIAVKGFRLIRNDTDSGKRKHGVCVYVRDDLALGHVHTDHPNTVGIVLPEFNLLLLVVYRPPSNTLDMDLELVDFISSMCDRGSVCLMGDFNLPTVDWSSEPPAAASYRDRIFLDCFAHSGLSQHVFETTFVPSGMSRWNSLWQSLFLTPIHALLLGKQVAGTGLGVTTHLCLVSSAR